MSKVEASFFKCGLDTLVSSTEIASFNCSKFITSEFKEAFESDDFIVIKIEIDC